MYRLTNLTLDKTTNYKTKDLLYQAIERENARVKHEEAESLLVVEELDKKQIVVYSEEIFLPYEGIAESLFLNTSEQTAEEPSKRSFFKRAENQSTSKTETVKEPQTPKIEATEEVGKGEHRPWLAWFGKGLLMLSVVGSLSAAGATTMLVWKQEKELSTLTDKVAVLTDLQAETGKLDAFVRYFLPHYYSEQGQIEDFIAPGVTITKQNGQIQSVILESSSRLEDKTYQLVYVLALKTAKSEQRSLKRLTIEVKKVSSSIYGYQVVKVPEEVEYPK